MPDPTVLHFNHARFVARDLEEARRLTVGNAEFAVVNTGASEVWTTEQRWEPETNATVDRILRELAITAETTVLDFGCGVGRIAKPLIERTGCKVVGVDLPLSMREIALEYVYSPRFAVCTPQEVVEGKTPRFDFAIARFMLEHSLTPQLDLETIRDALNDGGVLMVFNERKRHVPTVECGFVDDGLDILGLTVEVFGNIQRYGKFDPKLVHPLYAMGTYWSTHIKGLC